MKTYISVRVTVFSLVNCLGKFKPTKKKETKKKQTTSEETFKLHAIQNKRADLQFDTNKKYEFLCLKSFF